MFCGSAWSNEYTENHPLRRHVGEAGDGGALCRTVVRKVWVVGETEETEWAWGQTGLGLIRTRLAEAI